MRKWANSQYCAQSDLLPWRELIENMALIFFFDRRDRETYIPCITKKGNFWGYIRPKTRKHDLNQNNVGPKRGKPDFVWPKTGKPAGHIRPQIVNHDFHQSNVGSKTRSSNIVRPKTRKLLNAGKLAGHIRPKTGKHDFDQNQENHKNKEPYKKYDKIAGKLDVD